jgi:DNA-directed RNA polymerase subunit RPC12/RpoP
VRCPQCAGELQYEPGDSQVTCAHCGYTLMLPRTDLVNGEARLVGDLRLERRFRPVAWVQVDRVLQCQQCGAELTMTRHLVQVCLFCGSPNVLNAQARPGIEQPDGFLPFALDEGEVRQALDDAARGILGRLWPWRSGPQLRVRELQAFYLPFWVFDGFVEARSTRMSLFDRNDPRAKPQVTIELLIFENILLSGADAPSREFQADILPFDVGALVPYEPRLLAGWPAELYSLDVEAAVEAAQASMLRQAVRAAAAREAEPRLRVVDDDDDEEREVRRSFRVTSATYQLVLLPAWAALLEVKGKLRLALVNGQTGKVALGRPLRAAREDRRA